LGQIVVIRGRSREAVILDVTSLRFVAAYLPGHSLEINDPEMTLEMTCEEVPTEEQEEEPRGKSTREPMEPPEYYHVSSRTTIINKDLVMTCETCDEEEDNLYAHSEDLSLKQISHLSERQEAFEKYERILKEKMEEKVTVRHLESLDQDKTHDGHDREKFPNKYLN